MKMKLVFSNLEDKLTMIVWTILGALDQQRSKSFIFVSFEQENQTDALETLVWQQFISCVR